ncbi:SixA phosphatase family protein [Luteimonas sp. e5]
MPGESTFHLLLLRHAEAEMALPGQADAERALSAHGRAQAVQAGHWLRDEQPSPDLLLCSPALRTRQTLDGVAAAGCRLPPARFEPAIYEASLGQLLGVIEDARAAHVQARRLWLIGHNPGLEQLLAHFAADARLRPMPVAAIAVLDFGHAVAAGGGRLAAWRVP